jgi:phage N-6-adenine-methyltransferase
MADYQGSTTNPAYRDMTQTPRWLYEALNAEFNFCLDAAALPETALHSNYLTPDIDALSVSWGYYIPADVRNPFVWLNPPYSDIGPWIKKCLKEKECGIGSVVLIPEDSSANWWPGDDCSEIRRIVGYYNEKGKFCSGRIHFINAETGEEMKGNPKGSNLLIFIPGCKYHIGTKHVSKGELLAIGNPIITAEAILTADPEGECLLDYTEAQMQGAAA